MTPRLRVRVRTLGMMAACGIVGATFVATPAARQAPAQAPAPPAEPAKLKAPPGFSISVFASDLPSARLMAVSPEGVLLVAQRRTNEVVALPDRDKDGRAEPHVLLGGLTNAHSLAFKDGYLYIATTPAVMRVRWVDGKPSGTPETFVALPDSTPSLHVSRTIAFGKDGRLYVSIGSSCNVCVEPDARRTTIQVVEPGSTTLRPFAIGTRNAIGFDWDPQTGRLWAHDTGQDGLGEDTPPEELNLIEDGKHYGYPFFIGRNLPNPAAEMKGIAAAVTADAAVPPALELPPHVTGIDLRFYTGAQFPAAYRNALFLSLHGSTTIPAKVGYKVVRVVMKDGRPTGLEDFVTGWLENGVVFGRPAGLATGRDGALYISDDNKGFIYRVAYDAATP